MNKSISKFLSKFSYSDINPGNAPYKYLINNYKCDVKKFGNKKPMNVSITGATGNIGYAIAFRIAHGDMLGQDQPVNLKLVDIPEAENKMIGMKYELEDCSFPALNEITTHTSLSSGFKDADVAMLIGIKQTVSGGERADGLLNNAEIMRNNGKAINENADRDVKVLIVGNPVNTNCLIAMKAAPNLKPQNFHSMSRLDHNRTVHKLADIFKVHYSLIEKVFIWGNHDATMYPELEYGYVNSQKITEVLDRDFIRNEFVDIISTRWKEIIQYRCLTSCASAANSAIDHVRDWHLGTKEWVSKGIYSDGSLYGVPKDIMFSFPVTVNSASKVMPVKDLVLNDYTKEKIRITTESLLEERRIVEKYL